MLRPVLLLAVVVALSACDASDPEDADADAARAGGATTVFDGSLSSAHVATGLPGGVSTAQASVNSGSHR